MDILAETAGFGAKLLLLFIFFAAIVALGVRARGGLRDSDRPAPLKVTPWHRQLEDRRQELELALAPPAQRRAMSRQQQKRRKERDKAEIGGEQRDRLLVLDFDGDLRASGVGSLRDEITALLQVAGSRDEVLLRLESPGGMVHAYGLAASQLARIRERGIRLTVAVDKVAASGGYMMACVADRIVAAPFAVIGSIGVVLQLPNFHRLLKRKDIDFELLTAGEHKRTLTLFGENTDEARAKAGQELEETHDLFKQFIARYRPALALETVATGEHWFGSRAKELGLVDDLLTSDDYLLRRAETHDIFHLQLARERPLLQRLAERLTLARKLLWRGERIA